MAKKLNLGNKSSCLGKEIFYPKFGVLAITFEPEMLESGEAYFKLKT